MAYQLLLDGMTQDCRNVLLNAHGNFKITKCLNLFHRNQQITRIQFGNIFVTDYREDISFKALPYGITIIIRPFCFRGEPRFGYCSEGACIITFGFKLFSLCLFLCIRVNTLSQKPSGLVTALSCVRKRNSRVNTDREKFLLSFETVGHLPVFRTFRGNTKEHTKAISQLIFLLKGFCIFCFNISQ
ncbi:Uncharacterised protein [Klebsiella pneumoniae]|nr:Uncharacterised protein [Klebsiella pneumoniae]